TGYPLDSNSSATMLPTINCSVKDFEPTLTVGFPVPCPETTGTAGASITSASATTPATRPSFRMIPSSPFRRRPDRLGGLECSPKVPSASLGVQGGAPGERRNPPHADERETPCAGGRA